MLYHLLFPLREYISGLNLFRYITFRAGMAAVTALLISFLVGPIIIRWLKKKGMIEIHRADGPAWHLQKPSAATMGGIIILISLLSGTLLFARWDSPQVWILIIATTWMGIVGLVDDWKKSFNGKKGLSPAAKLFWQFLLGLLIGVYLYLFPETLSSTFAEYCTKTTFPFFKNTHLNLAFFGIGLFYIIIVTLLLAATSNAVNLTDGLDGLAIGIVGIIATGLAGLAYVTGHAIFARYLNIIFLPGSGEISIYCAALMGASLGFLWFNVTPAQVYMGDTGALSLGAGIATSAILIKKELFLFLLGGVLVAEVASVLIQRYWFKWTRKRYGEGRRVFRMAPLHHHFELGGWSEPQVVVRFWIVGILLLFLTMTSFKVR